MPAHSAQEPFDAIVLAGGGSRRMGSDKAQVEIASTTLFDRALAAVADAQTIVVVGPRRPASEQIVFTLEQPPGSGPAAAIAHGLAHVERQRVVIVAVDVPLAAPAVPRLLAALSGHEAAMLVDEGGRRQPLIAAYLTAALRARAEAQSWAGRSVRALTEGLQVAEVAAIGPEALDCDTPDDVRRAQAYLQD